MRFLKASLLAAACLRCHLGLGRSAIELFFATIRGLAVCAFLLSLCLSCAAGLALFVRPFISLFRE